MKAALPYISIVVTSRNDNHGGDLLYRMQHFVTGVILQCNRHKVEAELIIVEWNPPENRASLSTALQFPEHNHYCKIRIIQVPLKLHHLFDNSEKIPLFQMIGKNVGIRRATGRFVLATNIDILFDDNLMRYIKRKKLRTGHFFRVDRFDIPSYLPDTKSFSALLSYCRKNVFRINTRFGTRDLHEKSNFINFLFAKICRIHRLAIYFTNKSVFRKKIGRFVYNLILNSGFHQLKSSAYRKALTAITQKIFPINTNACGDFTLLSADDWKKLRGYSEWPYHSWNMDGILLFQAKSRGIKEVALTAEKIYHIDHDGGYTPNGVLFENLSKKNIPYIDNLRFEQIKKEISDSATPILFNDENWGLACHELEEVSF